MVFDALPWHNLGELTSNNTQAAMTSANADGANNVAGAAGAGPVNNEQVNNADDMMIANSNYTGK